MATCRSERTSLPQCPASPDPSDFTSAEPVMTYRNVAPASRSREGILPSPHQFPAVKAFSRLLQLLQNRIAHLNRACRSLSNRFRSARNSHHVVGTHFAFFDDIGDSLADAVGFRAFAYVIEHHRGGENHRDGIHNRRIQLRILGRRTMRRLKYGDFVADVAGSSKAQSAYQSGERIGQDIAEQV